jgi:energy-coupling factor transport system ATP-binding protein
MISVKNVSYTYPSGNAALSGINLEVKDGEYVAVVGRNGSGKSTLARLLAGLDRPTSGDILINGINTRSKKQALELRKNVGIVFQNPENQLVFEKVADDIRFGLVNLGVPPDELPARVEDAVKRLNIEHFTNSFELSMGQKQRVAIASVVAMKPQCIIFDEPTAMLDPKGKKDIRDIIKELQRGGMTIVYVTNIIDEVVAADRLVVLTNGRKEAEYQRDELFDNVDKLKATGLEMPVIMEMLFMLRQKGIDIVVKRWAVDAVVESITDYIKEIMNKK